MSTVKAEVYEVNLDEISISGVVGEGSFSEVYRGKWRDSDVAVKKLNLSKSIRASTKDSDEMSQMRAIVHSFRREISIMKELDHPNILSFVGCVFSREVQVIVTEFMIYASIVDFMGQKGEMQYNASLRDRFAHDVANGMTYLHSLNILQRDRRLKIFSSMKASCVDRRFWSCLPHGRGSAFGEFALRRLILSMLLQKYEGGHGSFQNE